MRFRNYQASDIDQVFSLFYQTVHSINVKDYSMDQVNAWAPKNYDKAKLNQKLLSNYSIVAIKNNQIMGFADISPNGYIDHLYVSHTYQRQGLGKLLLKALEESLAANTHLSSHVSITAVKFFEANGFTLVSENIVERDGIELINYYMTK